MNEEAQTAAIERGALTVGMLVGGLAASLSVHLLAGPIGAYLGAVMAGVVLEAIRGKNGTAPST